MIHLIATIGAGNRKAPVISDGLIIDVASAVIRANQELAKATYVVISRTLLMPHEPDGDHAVESSVFAFQPLALYGRHYITARTISLTPTKCEDSVTMEQYRYLDMPA